MAETRIQSKSRPTKRPIAIGEYNTTSLVYTHQKGRKPRLDKRGYPAQVAEGATLDGVPFPVLVAVTAVA